MARPLTPRQRQILEHLALSIRRSGVVPSIREIGRAVGLRSPSTVHQHLDALERKGYIKRGGDRMRVLQITDRSILPDAEEVVSLPLVGRVSAGLPILAEECRNAAENSQVFVSTHSPYFVNGLRPEELNASNDG